MQDTKIRTGEGRNLRIPQPLNAPVRPAARATFDRSSSRLD